MTNLIAYHGNQSEKDAILAQLAAHRAADELIKGQYWEDGKGCAVGCTLHSSNHIEYESRFGIPVMLAQLEDAIFEALDNGAAQAWPERFMSAIRPGADLSLVGWELLHWLLTDQDIIPGIADPAVKDVVKRGADLMAVLKNGGTVSKDDAARVARAAWAAMTPAAGAARAAEWAAWAAAGAARAAQATRAAEWAARAAQATRVARAAWAATGAAVAVGDRQAAYAKMADKLIELIKAK